MNFEMVCGGSIMMVVPQVRQEKEGERESSACLRRDAVTRRRRVGLNHAFAVTVRGANSSTPRGTTGLRTPDHGRGPTAG